eukprot:4688757-Amphidinium_carterae.1
MFFRLQGVGHELGFQVDGGCEPATYGIALPMQGGNTQCGASSLAQPDHGVGPGLDLRGGKRCLLSHSQGAVALVLRDR